MAPQKPSKLIYIYAEQDKALVSELDKHLISLRRQGLIESWHPGMLKGGDAVDAEIEKHIDDADIILLMLSVDFMNAVHVYEVQLKRAMERQGEGKVRVIPILLRSADYQGEPFSELQALPQDSRPISGRSDSERDEIWAKISRSIKEAVSEDPLDRIAEAMSLSVAEAQISPSRQYFRPSPWVAIILIAGLWWPIYQWYMARHIEERSTGQKVNNATVDHMSDDNVNKHDLPSRDMRKQIISKKMQETNFLTCAGSISNDGEISVSGKNHEEVLFVLKELLKQKESLKLEGLKLEGLKQGGQSKAVNPDREDVSSLFRLYVR